MKKFVFICLLFNAVAAFADSVATVLFTLNSVTASHGGASRSLARGGSLEVGDKIVTGDGAKVNIKYSNGTLVNLGPNSSYTILSFSPNTNDVQVKAQLDQGSLSVKTNGRTKETLKTPVMAMAILGTALQVSVDKRHQNKTYVRLIQGKVTVTNLLTGETYSPRQNSTIAVTRDRIEQNAKMPQEQINALPETSSTEESSSAAGTEGAGDTGTNEDANESLEESPLEQLSLDPDIPIIQQVDTSVEETVSEQIGAVIEFIPPC